MREVDGQHVLSLYFVLLYFRLMVGPEVDGQHVFSLIFFLDIFRWMVDREVDGPVWMVLGRS